MIEDHDLYERACAGCESNDSLLPSFLCLTRRSAAAYPSTCTLSCLLSSIDAWSEFSRVVILELGLLELSLPSSELLLRSYLSLASLVFRAQ